MHRLGMGDAHPGCKAGAMSTSTSPSPHVVKAAREAAGLTQTDAARLVYSELRAWQRWEAGDRAMHPGLWELFRLKVGFRPV